MLAREKANKVQEIRGNAGRSHGMRRPFPDDGGRYAEAFGQREQQKMELKPIPSRQPLWMGAWKARKYLR